MAAQISTIAESKEVRGLNLIAAHSHVRGLGVQPDTLAPKPAAEGLVGQQKARKACAYVTVNGRPVLAAPSKDQDAQHERGDLL